MYLSRNCFTNFNIQYDSAHIIILGPLDTKWIVIHCIKGCINLICWWLKAKAKQVLEEQFRGSFFNHKNRTMACVWKQKLMGTVENKHVLRKHVSNKHANLQHVSVPG